MPPDVLEPVIHQPLELVLTDAQLPASSTTPDFLLYPPLDKLYRNIAFQNVNDGLESWRSPIGGLSGMSSDLSTSDLGFLQPMVHDTPANEQSWTLNQQEVASLQDGHGITTAGYEDGLDDADVMLRREPSALLECLPMKEDVAKGVGQK